MNKKAITKVTLIIFSSIILFSLISYSIFVFASHIVKTSSGENSFSVNQSISNLFNVSVNNTDATEDLNITSVIITFPSSFTFIADSNGTSAGTHTFSNISNTLNWTNDGLVMNNTLKYFWFNAIAAIPGAYNITVTTVNSTGDYMSNLSVQVNDTTNPIAAQGTAPIDNYNSTNKSITFDLRCSDNVNVSWIQLWTNTTGIWHANYTNHSYINNTWINITISGIPEGSNFKWAVWCNDTSGLTNMTENRTFNLDTPPIASQGTNPIDNYNSTNKSITFDLRCSDNVNVSWIQLWGDWTGTWKANYTNHSYINNTWINVTVDGISDGNNYNWSVWCNDTSGNTNITTNRTFTVDTIPPVASFGENPVNTYNSTNSSIIFDFKCVDDNVETIQLWTNITGLWQADYENSSELGYINDTLLSVNIPEIRNGVYNWAVYCNDTTGHSDWTDTNRTFRVNVTYPKGGCIGPAMNFTCGDILTENCTMNSNLTLNDTCFIIGHDNIIINCAHHKIEGLLNGEGIYSDGYDNITIENCLISNFTKGIYLRSSSGDNIIDNMIYGNIDIETAGGIEFDDVTHSHITQNNISYNSLLGIYLTSSSNNTINDNIISFNNPEGSYGWNGGIGDFIGGDNIIENNIIQDNKYFGVWLAPAARDIISNNMISSFGSSGYEIYMDTSLANITNNVLYGNSWGGLGIFSVDSNATVSRNKICGNNDGIEGGINDQITGNVINESGYINSTGYTLLEPTNARWIDITDTIYEKTIILNASDGSDITSAKALNESGYINSTGYILAKSTLPEFVLDSGDIEILNASDGEIISPENYTLDEDINITTSYGTVNNESGYIDATGYILAKSYTYPLLPGLNVSKGNITIVNASNGVVISPGNYTLNETDTFDTGGEYGPESGYINKTGYTLGISEFITDYYLGFSVDITNIIITNASDDSIISPGNYTFYLANYTLYNATNTTWDNVDITYDYEIDIPYYIIYNLTPTVWDNVNISYNYSYKTYTPDYIIYNLTPTVWDNVNISYNYTYMPYILVYNISSSDYLASYTLYNTTPNVWNNVNISYYYDYYSINFDGFNITNNTYCITLAPDALIDDQIIAAVDGYKMTEPKINFSYAVSNRIAKNFSDAKCYLYIDSDITNNTVDFNNLPGELWIENYSLDIGDHTWYVMCNDSYGNGAISPTFIITTAESSNTNTFEVDTTAGNTTTLSRTDTGTDVGLDINTAADETTDITINEYDNAPAGESAFTSNALGKYITITSGLTSMDWAIIKIYYDNNEITAAGLDESTLRIQYYNATSDTWTEYDTPNGGVNTASNYVWANVTHFSLFGAFGDKKKGGGGGGGGGNPPEENVTNATSENVTNPVENQSNGNQITCGSGYKVVNGKCVKETESKNETSEVSQTIIWPWVIVIVIIVALITYIVLIRSKKRRDRY